MSMQFGLRCIHNILTTSTKHQLKYSMLSSLMIVKTEGLPKCANEELAENIVIAIESKYSTHTVLYILPTTGSSFRRRESRLI